MTGLNRTSMVLLALLLVTVVGLMPLQAGQSIIGLPGFCQLQLSPWTTGAALPVNHIEGATAVVDGRLYIFGGFTTDDLAATTRIDVYNPALDVWETVANPRQPMPMKVSHIIAAVDGATVWIAGGYAGDHPGQPTAEVWQYNTVTDEWSTGPALQEPRASGAFGKIANELHYIGGLSDRDTTHDDHWVLHLDNLAAGWTSAPPVPNGRAHAAFAAVDQHLYTIGGQFRHDHDPLDLNLVEVYDLTAKTWFNAASLPAPRSHFEPGTTLVEGHIVIVGGRNNTITGEGTLEAVTYYSPAQNQWFELTALPVGLIAPNAAYVGGRLIVTGGGVVWNVPQTTTYISTVTLTNCETDALALIAPAADEVIHTGAYPFRWTDVTGTTRYKVKIRTPDRSYTFTQTFTDPAAICADGICSTPLDFGAQPPPNHTALKWKVIAFSGEEKWLTKWRAFMTEMPGSPILTAPVDQAAVADTPVFSWGRVPGATAYRLKVKNLTTGEKVLVRKINDTTDPPLASVCDPANCLLTPADYNLTLDPGTAYRWQVQASNDEGKSQSANHTFNLTASVGAPTASAPAVLSGRSGTIQLP